MHAFGNADVDGCWWRGGELQGGVACLVSIVNYLSCVLFFSLFLNFLKERKGFLDFP